MGYPSRRYYAQNDSLIEDLLQDPRYEVRADGTVYRLVGGVWRRTGKAITNKNGMRYRHLMYRGRNLLVHRIIFAKYIGKLSPHLVVNHIDGDSLNNLALNLELISQSENVQHRYTPDQY